MELYYTYFCSEYAYIIYNYAMSLDPKYDFLFRSPEINTDMAIIALIYVLKHKKH